MKEQQPIIQQLQPKIDAEKAADKAAANELHLRRQPPNVPEMKEQQPKSQ